MKNLIVLLSLVWTSVKGAGFKMPMPDKYLTIGEFNP